MDALFGNDGTQPLVPAPFFPDAVSGFAAPGVKAAGSLAPRTRPPAPVKPRRPSNRLLQAVANHRPAAPARRVSSEPEVYASAARTSHVPAPTLPAPKQHRGREVLGGLIAVLLILGTLGFPVLHGILQRLGIPWP